MSLRVKICGMRDLANIADVAALAPDYMGFIFYKSSPRYVGVDFKIPKDFPQAIKRVGVFVQEKTKKIVSLVKAHQLDFVQLHGHELVEQCAEIKASGIGVIKVFSIERNFDFKTVQKFENCSDYFLFDTKGMHYGGNAEVFDWNLLKKYDQKIPFFLSGGIKAENVEAIQDLKNLNIHAVDVNSGVESDPGVKSVDKIAELKRAISSLLL